MSGLKELQKGWLTRSSELLLGTCCQERYGGGIQECASALQPHIEHMEALESVLRRIVDWGLPHNINCSQPCDCGAWKLANEARSILGAKEEGL